MTRILLRADAYPAIGTGDLMSLIHFSRHPEVIQAGWHCHFIVRDHPVARTLLKRCPAADTHLIPAAATVAEEAEAVARCVSERGMDAVLFEITGRRLERGDIDGIDAVVGAIDFYNWIPPGLDLVVNWDTEAGDRYRRQDFPGTDFFLGPEFVFLSPAFVSGGRRWQNAKDESRPVVVAMGGADEFNMTCRILSELILRSAHGTPFTAIVGAGYAHVAELRALAAATGARATVKHDVADMCGEFLGARHVFGAGGLTAYELVATGTPCSLVASYEHQVHRCRTFAERGWARYLGHRSALAAIEMPPDGAVVTPESGFVSRLDHLIASLEKKIRRRRSPRAETAA